MSSGITLNQLQLELLEMNTLVLEGRVDEAMERYVREAIRQLELRGSPPITIRLTSDGGYSLAGVYIGKHLKDYSGHKTVKVYGAVRSAAVFILLQGDLRRCEKNAKILAHEGTTTLTIPAKAMRKPGRVQELVDEALEGEKFHLEFYCEKTGMDPEAMQKLLEEDRDIDAEEALRLGFVHEIF